MDSSFKADPEKYAEMSKPFESKEKAQAVAAEFFNAVRKLREQYRIAELIIQFDIYVSVDDGVAVMMGGGGWGNQNRQAKLAKRAFDQEFDHLGMIVEGLAERLPKVGKALITDPSCEEEGAGE